MPQPIITKQDIDDVFSDPAPLPEAEKAALPPVSAPTALAVRGDRPPPILISEAGQVIIADFDQAQRLGKALYGSQMYPESWVQRGADAAGAVASIAVCLMFGRENGFSLTQTMTCVYVVNRKPALHSDGPIAKVYQSGLLKEIKENWEGDGDKLKCTVTVWRKQRDGDEPSGPHTRSFSVEDAKQAQLRWAADKGKQRRMCQCRARAWVLRDVFPDVLMGLAIAEEYEGTELDQPRETTIGQRLNAD